MDKVRNPETHTITITVDEKGDFRYDNPLVWVHQGDTIVWEFEKEWPFAIHGGWGSPFEWNRKRSVDGTSIEVKVREDALPGYYHYAVAVFEEKTRKIWVDDPPLIVKPPPKH